MKTSKSGLDLIKHFEGVRLQSYLCPAGVWTIGYGHTKGVKAGQEITEDLATMLLEDDLREAEAAVVKYVRVDLAQNQFDALVSFTFNVGTGNLKKSTLAKMAKQNPSNPLIENEFLKWKNARVNGKLKPLPGLIRRRQAEANLYFMK